MLRKSKKSAKAKTKVRAKAKKKAPKPKHVGVVTHYFTEISVAIVRFNKKIPVGTTLHYKGATSDFKETAKSMQYDHKPVTAAPKGKQVGIKVKRRVREGDKVHVAG